MTKKNNTDDELVGFKDFLEYLGVDKGERGQPGKAGDSNRRQHSFELITFLGHDANRLKNHIKLFEEKTYMIKNYPQATSLQKEQTEINSKLKTELIEMLNRDDSPLFKYLAEIFNAHFRL